MCTLLDADSEGQDGALLELLRYPTTTGNLQCIALEHEAENRRPACVRDEQAVQALSGKSLADVYRFTNASNRL